MTDKGDTVAAPGLKPPFDFPLSGKVKGIYGFKDGRVELEVHLPFPLSTLKKVFTEAFTLDELLRRLSEKNPKWLLVSDLRSGDVLYLYNLSYRLAKKEKTSCTFTSTVRTTPIEHKLPITRGMIWTGDLNRPEAPAVPIGMIKITLPEEVTDAIAVFANHPFGDDANWLFEVKDLEDAQEVLENWATDPFAEVEEK